MAIKLPSNVRLLGKMSTTISGPRSKIRIIYPGAGRHRIYVSLRKRDRKVESFRTLDKAIAFVCDDGSTPEEGGR